ncbi:hypothetical protein [Clostridium tagluense]|uniref:Oxaloacetate decarboxylase n=1 Tax=Clostridium tagluense TaxID=360422 RepID=A0A401UP40_9CLOT|nr:hypothetical protein [Clostridium tagluense]GCD11309.1 hypothetical protein Ctaglu_29320 [Clostridium tagluense]
MSQGLGITLLTIGGLASMGMIAFVFIKTIINTTKYANKKNEDN